MKIRKTFFYVLLVAVFALTACSSENGTENSGTEKEEVNSLEKIEGFWEGSINVPNQPLPINVSFQEQSGTISIPVQGLNDYPLTSVDFSEPELSFEMNIQRQLLTFDGEVEEEIITGTFTQQGQSFPFELAKGTEETVDERDRLETEVEGGVMKAVLETPEGQATFPVMIIIAGSGPTDKDGNSMAIPGKNNSLKMLTEELAAQGVASIRYDKRGIGDNTALSGSEEELRFDDYIKDAAAWVEFAKNDERFSEVGIIGHSEGSLIGMVAAHQTEADAFVSLSGAARPIDELLQEQLEAQLPEELMAEAETILGQLKEGQEVQTVNPELQSVFRPSVQPYMISWLQYDPAAELSQLEIPVLIAGGTHDLQVPASDAEALHKAKKNADLLIVEEMNHVLKQAPEDQEENIATYAEPDLPLAEGLMDGIANFLEDHHISGEQ